MTMSPAVYGGLADAVLVSHMAFVGFVILGLVLVLVGGWCGWRWVRYPVWRGVHLAAIVFVVVQSWLGIECPLTTWEKALRRLAGVPAYDAGFIETWLSRLLYYRAPAWVFITAYTTFGLLVVASWWWVRPRRPGRPANPV